MKRCEGKLWEKMLTFSGSAPAVFHFPRFFFSTQFKQYQSQQISARYGRFHYNTPEHVEKVIFWPTNVASKRAYRAMLNAVKGHSTCQTLLNENKNGRDRFRSIKVATGWTTISLFSTHSKGYNTARHLLSDLMSDHVLKFTERGPVLCFHHAPFRDFTSWSW